MPTISRFFGITIAMFFDDHGYPHFHARHAEGEAKVRIDNLEVIDSINTLQNTRIRLTENRLGAVLARVQLDVADGGPAAAGEAR